MGSDLSQLLEQEARTEADKALAEARARAEELVGSARRDADETLESARRRAEDARVQARARATSTASLRASAVVLVAKDEAIRKVFSDAEAAIRDAMNDPARRRTTIRALLREASDDMPGGRVVVEVSPADGDAAREACRELGLDADVRENPQVTEGVRLSTDDGRAILENTLPSRLSRARREMVSRVAEALWGR